MLGTASEHAEFDNGVEITHENGDPLAHYMPVCSVTCGICGVHVGEALHLCCWDSVYDARTQQMEPVGACVNICEGCYRKIAPAIPTSWKGG